MIAARINAAALLATLALAAAPAAQAAPPAHAGPPPAADGSGRYLVRYAPGTDVAGQARGLRDSGLTVRRTFSHAVRAAAVTATPAAAAALARNPHVLTVEPDAVVSVSDTQTSAPWGLDRIDQTALPLSTTYTPAGTGAGVEVYVVDTGVRADHTDFGGRVEPGYDLVGDGRGTTDCNGHGTHVAGTVAGTTYGVAKAARVVPVRVLGCDGSGYLSDVVAGLDWVAADHTAGAPAVVNLSLGGSVSPTLDAALDGVVADGVTATVAAGNDGADACQDSPARVPAALTVAASDSSDRQASFSNVGSCVDLFAPGVSVRSDYYTSTTATATMSGTSMAAPHVAGAAAAVLSQDPTLTPTQVSAALLDAAVPGVLTGVSPGTANRLLFVPTLGATPAPTPEPSPATVPSAATDVSARAGRRSAGVTWVRGDDGGSALTSQTVVVYSGATRLRTVTVSASATGTTVSGLKPRRTYAFTVIETNAVGSGPESARSSTVTVTARRHREHRARHAG